MSAEVRECGSGARPRRWWIVCALLVVLPAGGCGNLCGDEVVQHEPSPYGPGTAVVFVRNCGATTGFSTQVAIVGQETAEARDQAVVFVADTDQGAAPSAPAGGPSVRVRWIDATRLEIAHHPRARAFRKESEHGGVRITYVTPDS